MFKKKELRKQADRVKAYGEFLSRSKKENMEYDWYMVFNQLYFISYVKGKLQEVSCIGIM